jgi:threonine dehydrogenase-like Zn-dependent dehydrogenase
MLAAVIYGAYDIRVEAVADPAIEASTDAIVRVTQACICGSDLWAYQGVAKRDRRQRIGHEFVGVVEEIGKDVRDLKKGDSVVAPFMWSDGTCVYCRESLYTSCVDGGFWGEPGSDGGQGEAVRVPHADGTLVKLPGGLDGPTMAKILTLSDVMCTGHHAALEAGAGPGVTVAVVGDGAVGLCGVLAAKRLGADRIISMGRHESRARIARAFGATDLVPERGEEAIEKVKELTAGQGAHAVIEAVGTEQSMHPVFDQTVGLQGVPDGYAAMNGRTALKVLVLP